MIIRNTEGKLNLLDVLSHFSPILVALTLLKTLYVYTKIPKGAGVSLAVLSSIPVLVFCYGLFFLFDSKKRFIYQIAIHFIISFLLFGDLIYFSFYGILPTVYDLKQAGDLPEVWQSVNSLLKPGYFLMFADFIPLLFLYRRTYKIKVPYHTDRNFKKTGLLILLSMLIIASANIIFLYNEEAEVCYERFGILNYHIMDISKAVTAPLQRTQEVDLSEPVKANKKNELFGVAKGRNVIVIQVEALQNFVINCKYEGQELTPNLNKLLKSDTIYFDKYYYTVSKGNTSDAEFAIQNSLYPVPKVAAYKTYDKNTYYSLPKLLKDNGYTCAKAFHGYKGDYWNRSAMYPILGFDDFISAEDFNINEKIGLGLSDESFFKQSVSYLKEMKSPYYAFMVTLSSHNPFKMDSKYRKIKLQPKHQNTMFGDYINAIHYADYALGKFIEDLKSEGLYDNSIIAIYGDHYSLHASTENNFQIMSEFLGREYTVDEFTNVPLIINIPGVQQKIPEKISTVGSHVDFYPTLINLLGIEPPDTKLFGQDLVNAENGFVVLRNFLMPGSFIDDEKVLIIHGGHRFETAEAWNLKTKERIDVQSCREGYERAIKELKQSEYILNNDLIKTMLVDK